MSAGDDVIPRQSLLISGQDEGRRQADDIILRRDVLWSAGNELALAAAFPRL
jgi:hypothetical protein